MIYPSIDDLSQGKYNRYMLCIATAKCARTITDEQNAEAQQAWRETKDDKLATRRLTPSEKPVRVAINKLYSSHFSIYMPEDSHS